MENSFLYQRAKAYAAQGDVPLRRCLFVFPSRRSSLFFQKYLGQCSGKPILSPDMLTISDLFARLSPFKRGDKIQLLYILWQQYCEVGARHGRPTESFDDFVSLGETLAADFNDIDKYLADHAKLLANIRDLRQLDSGYEFLSEDQKDALKRFWGVIASGKESKAREQFLSLWEILDELYVAFQDTLQEAGIAYEGMLQREVAERIKEGDTAAVAQALSGYDRIVVIGQNALCPCETALYNYIKTDFDGDFYWDFYGECLQDEANKASRFIRSYIDDYPHRYNIEAEAAQRPEITVVAASSAVAQAKAAASFLAESSEDSTAVVLPDENLLMPLLNSIPENIRHINVTMGYGLHNSSTASLVDMMAALQLDSRAAGFYHKDVTAILNHPFLRTICPEAVAKIKQDMVKDNVVYVPEETFASDEVLRLIFTPKDDVVGICDWQMAVLGAIAPSLPEIEREFAHGYYTSVSHLKDLQIDMAPRTYFRFLREVASRLTVDFRGEPLSGLQVMGPLEVRAIDFDILIVLSVNEGIFPAKVQNDSLIPYNVRHGFGLPVPELFDSIAAYHFYRSIYRAKKVVLIYDSRTKGMLSGEESRFIKQLKYHYGFEMKQMSVDLEIKPVEGETRDVEKTPEVLRMMHDHFFVPDAEGKYKALSASSVMQYMECPLKFYYSQIVGLAEEEEVSEELDAGQFGDTFHHTMQTIYNLAGMGKVVEKAWIANLLKDENYIRETVTRELNKVIKRKEDSPLSKRNQITANLIAEMVTATLKNDLSHAPFTYLDSEHRCCKPLDINVGGQRRQVYFKGFIDRLDKDAGGVRICDYKTGSVKEVKSFLDPKCLDMIFDGKAKTSFQLLTYAMLMNIEDSSLKEFQLAVYDVKKLFNGSVETKFCPWETLEEFNRRLTALLEEIFNPDVPFTAVESGGDFHNPCTYCPAKAICGR